MPDEGRPGGRRACGTQLLPATATAAKRRRLRSADDAAVGREPAQRHPHLAAARAGAREHREGRAVARLDRRVEWRDRERGVRRGPASRAVDPGGAAAAAHDLRVAREGRAVRRPDPPQRGNRAAALVANDVLEAAVESPDRPPEKIVRSAAAAGFASPETRNRPKRYSRALPYTPGSSGGIASRAKSDSTHGAMGGSPSRRVTAATDRR